MSTNPGKSTPRSCVSTKNWVSNWKGVESKGRPWTVGSTSFEAAIVCLQHHIINKNFGCGGVVGERDVRGEHPNGLKFVELAGVECACEDLVDSV